MPAIPYPLASAGAGLLVTASPSFDSLPLNSTNPDATFAGPTGSSTSISGTLTAVVTTLTLLMAFTYTCVLLWAYRNAARNPRALNKKSGVRVQKFGPLIYALVVFIGLSVMATSSWLLAQYQHSPSFPNIETRAGVRLVLFSSIWTTLTSIAYTFLFLHPTLSTHPISSIGSQTVWLVISWVFWIASAATMNAGVPRLFFQDGCSEVVYCDQLQGLYALSVLQVVTMTLGIMFVAWLAREIVKPGLRPLSLSVRASWRQVTTAQPPQDSTESESQLTGLRKILTLPISRLKWLVSHTH